MNGSRLTGLTCSKAPGFWMEEHQLVLNSHGASHTYSKHRLIVGLDIFCFDFAVASPNNNNKEKKNMENWKYFGSQ